MRFEDALYALQPDEELREISVIERRAELRQLPQLAEVAAARREALATALADAAKPLSIGEAAALAAATLTRVAAWLDHATLTDEQREARTRLLARHQARAAVCARMDATQVDAAQVGAAQVDAAQKTSRDAARTSHCMPQCVQRGERTRTRPSMIGSAALVDPVDLIGFTLPIAARVGLSEAEASDLLKSARRFPNARVDRVRRMCGNAATERLALVDRVDALLAALDGAPELPPTTRAFLTSARALLGRVIRDADWMLQTLESLPRSEAGGRRAAAVAAGLLGVVPPMASVVTGPDDAEGAAAWAVAVALSAAADDLAIALLKQLQTRTTRGAYEVATTALRRIAIGNRIAVL